MFRPITGHQQVSS